MSMAQGGRPGGLLPDHHFDNSTRRAGGGVGSMIVFGSGPVTRTASTVNADRLRNPGAAPRLAALATRVHAHGCRLLAQASHRGPRERPGKIDAVLQAPSPPSGADRLTYPGVRTSRRRRISRASSSISPISRGAWSGRDWTESRSPRSARTWIEQVWSPALDTRTDGYGGTFARRMPFAGEVLRAADAATADAFRLVFRRSCDPQPDPLGPIPDDKFDIADHVDGPGLADTSRAGGANAETHSGFMPTGTFPVLPKPTARRWEQGIGAPVLMAGRTLTPDHGEAARMSGPATRWR